MLLVPRNTTHCGPRKPSSKPSSEKPTVGSKGTPHTVCTQHPKLHELIADTQTRSMRCFQFNSGSSLQRIAPGPPPLSFPHNSSGLHPAPTTHTACSPQQGFCLSRPAFSCTHPLQPSTRLPPFTTPSSRTPLTAPNTAAALRALCPSARTSCGPPAALPGAQGRAARFAGLGPHAGIAACARGAARLHTAGSLPTQRASACRRGSSVLCARTRACQYTTTRACTHPHMLHTPQACSQTQALH